MLLPPAFYPHADCIGQHLPHPRPSQVQGLTLWVLAHGTRVEETHLRGLAPGRVRRPPLEPTVAQAGP